jgi:hypothetical protein
VTLRANWLADQFHSTDWQSSYSDWKARNAQADCQVFHGDGSQLFLPDEWCYRCSAFADSGWASRYFYVLDETDHSAARLRQFRGEVSQPAGLPLSALGEIHHQIENRLTSLYGKPQAADSLPSAVPAWGSADWHFVRIWHTPQEEIYLYRKESPGAKEAVGMLARDRVLESASTAQGQHLILEEPPDANFEEEVDSGVAAALGTQFSQVSAVLADPDEEPYPSAVANALTNLIDASRQAPLDQRAALLLAADRLAGRWRLPAANPLPAGMGSEVARLQKDDGMHFEWSELDGEWLYQHDLLWTLWHDAPDTEWGGDAFYLLLDRGWDPSGICKGGSDQFRAVVAQGEKYLEKYPEVPTRLPMLFLVAQAYETWWSLSQWWACSPALDPSTSPCGPEPSSAQYDTGAAAAREKAIAYYDQLAKADPDTYATPELRRRVARLKMGIDTNQRRFYCSND